MAFIAVWFCLISAGHSKPPAENNPYPREERQNLICLVFSLSPRALPFLFSENLSKHFKQKARFHFPDKYVGQ